MHVFWMGGSLTLPQGWCLHSGREIVRERVSYLGYIFHNLQQLRHPLHWANHTGFNKTLQTSWNYHSLSHPQLPGKVERTNGMLKLRVSNRVTPPDSLGPRYRPWSCWLFAVGKHNLIAHETVTGRAVSAGIQFSADSLLSHASMTSNYKSLLSYAKADHQQVKKLFWIPIQRILLVTIWGLVGPGYSWNIIRER